MPDVTAIDLALWLFDCDAWGQELLQLESRAPVLTAEEHARAARFTDDLARRRWMCARLALRCALGFHAGTAIERRAFAMTAQGRPYLAQPAPHFSLSHAGPHALIAVSAGAAPGCDLEAIAPRMISPARRSRLEAFAQRLSSEDLPEREDARFIQAWCRIEAAAKAEGCGVGRLLTRAGLMGPCKSPERVVDSAASWNAIAVSTRAADLAVCHLAPGFAAAVSGPSQDIASWQEAGVLCVRDGAAVLAAVRLA